MPEKFVDDYMEYLFGEAAQEEETDPFANIQLLMREYLEISHDHATDGNPHTNFALIPVASAGNFRTTLGAPPLKPASMKRLSPYLPVSGIWFRRFYSGHSRMMAISSHPVLVLDLLLIVRVTSPILVPEPLILLPL